MKVKRVDQPIDKESLLSNSIKRPNQIEEKNRLKPSIIFIANVGFFPALVGLLWGFDYLLYRVATNCKRCYTLMFVTLLIFFSGIFLKKKIKEHSMGVFMKRFLIFFLLLSLFVTFLIVILLSLSLAIRTPIIGIIVTSVVIVGMLYLFLRVKIVGYIKKIHHK